MTLSPSVSQALSPVVHGNSRMVAWRDIPGRAFTLSDVMDWD